MLSDMEVLWIFILYEMHKLMVEFDGWMTDKIKIDVIYRSQLFFLEISHLLKDTSDQVHQLIGPSCQSSIFLHKKAKHAQINPH